MIAKENTIGALPTLEQKYIEQYLLAQGYRLSDLRGMPTDVSQRLMRGASLYASLKLAELESKARLRKNIHYE